MVSATPWPGSRAPELLGRNNSGAGDCALGCHQVKDIHRRFNPGEVVDRRGSPKDPEQSAPNTMRYQANAAKLWRETYRKKIADDDDRRQK